MKITTVEVKNLKIDDVTWVYYFARYNAHQVIGGEPTDEAIHEYCDRYALNMLGMIKDGIYDNKSYTMPQEERSYEYQYSRKVQELNDMRDGKKLMTVLQKKAFMYDGSSDFITRFENWKLENNLIEAEVSVKFV